MIYIASDHAGYEMKKYLTALLLKEGVPFDDFGTFSTDEDDYPYYAKLVAKAVVEDRSHGILICGSGAGMAITANRFAGVRAAQAWNIESIQRARQEDDANIVCLPARLITNKRAFDIVKTFLTTAFHKTEKYQRRIKEIDGN